MNLKNKAKVSEKAKNKVVQCKLVCGNQHMVTHIEHRFKGKTIKSGLQVELKDDDRLWTVDEVYGDPVDKSTLHTDWHNNI